ncbi:uncharacterized protein LOC134841911 [Symsagittifera roscoffensis]|uniref:uncharacterized protein LOC134841911 n=1 Tax=Symsagittifera roscoffensis TaxID=84072 RepID=UPI00307CB9B3
MAQKRNEEIAYFSLSCIVQVLIIMCMCMANTAYWRLDQQLGEGVTEHRVGIWQNCIKTDGETNCERYNPVNRARPEEKAHLNAARSFVILAILTSSLVLLFFLLELCNLTGSCGKFCSRYGFVCVLLIQLAVVTTACSLCQSYFNKNYSSFRLHLAGWLAWVGFILCCLTQFASFLYLRYQDYW